MASWSRSGTRLWASVRRLWPLGAVYGYRRAARAGLVGSVLAGGFVHINAEPQRKLWGDTVYAKEEMKKEIAPPMSMRRFRFNQFASMIYEDEPYMTPRDFLHSVLMENVDNKLQKKKLTEADVDEMIKIASRIEAGTNLFRGIGDKESDTGFHIAFKMLDIDGSETVDKMEFQKLKKVIGPKKKLRQIEAESSDTVEEVNTTLQVFFFGKNGTKKLQYKDFCRFMEDLQEEVQEVEFTKFSKGMKTMRREDFAEWLLHFTNEEDNDAYWDNMRKRIPSGQSITFDEFKEFCLFTNHLEDFTISVKMSIDASKPIGIAQFKRAVKIATDHDLSDNVLDTVFKIFDLDGDNCLSHKEFLAVMKDRVHRGLRVQPQQGVSGFWKCVKREMLAGAQEALRKSGSPI
ncbi:hypothetical protein DNTS_031894 [Danionella cerebrum]|uniref:EF-hand domain-containing protein n=1 Tax=Danionella cerebrum TaxID=2873325 RepID=A0A553RH34_9TELE|nr:hypothetical protein DNTS_031894 [Danionella translucida]